MKLYSMRSTLKEFEMYQNICISVQFSSFGKLYIFNLRILDTHISRYLQKYDVYLYTQMIIKA